MRSQVAGWSVTDIVGWPDWRVALAEPADRRAAIIALAGGVAFDVGVRSGVASVGGCLAALVAAVGLQASGRVHTAASRTCLAAAAVISLFLPLRMSPWLVPADVLAIAGLLLLGAMLARDGRLTDLSLALLASRAVLAVIHAARAAGFLVDPARRWLARGDREERFENLAKVGRGAALAVPLVAVLVALFVSADAVFASMLRVHISVPGNAVAHLMLTVIGALGMAGVLRLASASPSRPLPPTGWKLGVTEWTIVRGSVAALFAAFATVQVVAAAGGAHRVLETRGLTYAAYARTGYFQLLAVAVLTAVVLGLLSAVADRSTRRDRRRFTVLTAVSVALTFLVLLVALRRLSLYEDAYGWTLLRLVAKAGAVWIGLALVLLAMRLAGLARDRAWFTPAAGALAFVILVVLNACNPEALVVRHDLGRAGGGRRYDPAYLATLSDDAVPASVGGVADLPEKDRRIVVRGLCRPRLENHAPLSWNRATSRADHARARLCSASTQAP